MVLGICVFLVFCFVCIIYLLYLKEYKDLMGNYSTLVKVLETRNLILLRILPELKNKGEQVELTRLIDEQIKSKKLGINATIKTDVELNKKLKNTYDKISKMKNPIVFEEFRRIIKLEKSLKIIRREINKSVDEYNQNLLDHKFVCNKILRMRPANSYKLGNE